MALSWFALAAALQAQASQAAPMRVDLGSVFVTEDTLELEGAGRFRFEPDPTGFDVVAPPGGSGVSFTVRLWFDPSGKPVGCDAGQQLLPQAARTGCAQLMKSASFQLLPGMAAPFRRGFVDVRFSFFNNPPAPELYAFPSPAYRNTTIIYPPDTVADGDRLRAADGRLIFSIMADDYPPSAIRYNLESATVVLLGISRDGTVKTCRPLTGSGPGSAMLDNTTCAQFLRRARYEFAADAPRFDGLRYLKRALRWKMPE
ncbi:MAG: hypothetical protein ACO1O3_19255 [Sphingobium sp.]